ncbi:ATP-binding protein, partial [Enterococcus faecalis]|uniref:sensor histidine kinase n=1 Tax=Enterococcus faecalis TaxID=1351 RepID=UPI0021B13358
TKAISYVLDNAVKYSLIGTEIKLAIKQKDGKAQILISDKGIGIKRSDLKEIFNKLYQGEISAVGLLSDKRKRSTGMSLAICQGIVQQHQGPV